MEGEKDENYLRNVGKSLLGNFPFQECGGSRTGLVAVRYPACFLVFTGTEQRERGITQVISWRKRRIVQGWGRERC